MAQTATVVAIRGQATATNAAGQSQPVVLGQVLQPGDRLITATGAQVDLLLDTGRAVQVGGGQAYVVEALEPSDGGAPMPSSAAEVPVPAADRPIGAEATNLQTVIQALERGGDLAQELEATAAGLAGGGDAGGSSFVRLLRISEDVSPLAYQYGLGEQATTNEFEGGVARQTVSGRLDLSATPQVDEGGVGIVYTVTLDRPVSAAMVVTLSNGAVVVVPTGAAGGSVLVPVQGDDPYVDAETVTATVHSVQGGGFDALVVHDTGATTQVSDTINPTQVGLSVGSVDEDAASVTFVATLSHPGQTDVTVVTSQGNIVIPAGQTMGSLVVNTANPDVYVDPSSITASVAGVVGGNFEAVDYSAAHATAQIADTVDTTTVGMSVASVNEDQASVTFTATLSHPGQTDVTVVTSLGNILIPAGQTTGSLVVNTADPDVYTDPGSLSNAVTGVVGGNFEAVDYSAAHATAQISDTIDTTTVSLSAGNVNEDQASATFTATLSHPGQTDVVVVTSHGDILIPAGQTSGTLVLDTADPDVYTDPSSVSVHVTGVLGGNFETVRFADASATAQIADTLDTTTVSLSANNVTEDQPGTTFTATLSHPGQSDVVVITDLGNILIPAGQTSGTLAVNTANPDVYTDPGSVSATVIGLVGGNFEAVNYAGVSATAQISDTTDTTFVSLHNVTAFEGGTATIGATVGAPVTGSDLLITLDNGATITIPVGQSSGTSSVFDVANADDPYVDNGQYPVGVLSVSGGNYEALNTSSSATVTFHDTIDPTGITLGDTTALEGGTATLTAAVGAPVTGSDLLITLDNGATITIPVGQSSGTSTVFAVANAEDPYVDAGQYSVGIASVSGGQYEQLTLTDTALVQFDDTPTPTYVTLGTGDVPETATEVVFTVGLSRPPQGIAMAQLQVGGTTYNVPLNDAGVGVLRIPFADNDVYLDADQIEARVTGVTGGHYESVVTTGAIATAHIYDVFDTTTFTLSGPAVVPESTPTTPSTLRYSVELDHPAETAVTVTLSNGATIAIAAGARTGLVDVPLPVGVNSISPVGIQTHTGGNFEQVAYLNTITTDVDSNPLGTGAQIQLVEGSVPSGSAVLTFNTGADAMDPTRFAFVNPSVSAPQVSGLSGADTLQWALINPTTLQAITTQGTLELTLSGATGQGVYVTATLNGNLLHTGGQVGIDNVWVDAYDTDGDHTSVAVALTVADTQPTVLFTSAVGSADAANGVYTGLWTASQGVDDRLPAVNGLVLDSATVDGQVAQVSLEAYNPGSAQNPTGTASGLVTSGGLSIPFSVQINPDGTYTVDLAPATKQVVITAGDYAGTVDPSGPVTDYTIQYVDPATQTTVSATASAVASGSTLSLYEYGQGTPLAVTTTGGGVNASSDGVGVNSNVLESYANKGVYTTEALNYNPQGQVSAVTLDFTGGGSNDFGGTKVDVLYLTLTGDAGQTQTIVLDSRHGDFIVNGDQFTPISTTAYSGGPLSHYTVTLPEGWTSIDQVQVVPGFHTDGDTVVPTDLKLAFGFTTATTVDVNVPVQLNFTASVTDADGDAASSAFTLATYTNGLATGTSGPDVLSGTVGADTYNAGAGNDLLLASAGGDALAGGEGVDTLSYALAGAAVSANLGAGVATLLGGGLGDTFSGVENVVGSAYGDVLTGNAGDNVLSGGWGDDALTGGGGFDTASYSGAAAGVVASLAAQGDATPDSSGGAGADTFSGISHLSGSSFGDVLTGDGGANTLSGEGGDDQLFGGAGNDVLRGGAGDDLISGGPGDDDLGGGTGHDTFDYNPGDTGHDTIRDFTLAHVDHGGDTLDLNDLLPDTHYTAASLDNHLSFSADAQGRAVITIDANGDGIPDDLQTITLDNISLVQLQAYADGDSDVAIIQKLLDNGNLRKDV